MCATNLTALTEHGPDTLPRGWTKHLAVYQLSDVNMVCCCLLTFVLPSIILSFYTGGGPDNGSQALSYDRWICCCCGRIQPSECTTNVQADQGYDESIDL